MREKGKLFLIGKCQLRKCRRNEEMRKPLTGNLHSNNCFEQEWSMIAKISEWKWVKQDIYLNSKYLLPDSN